MVIAVTAYQPGHKQRSWARLNTIVNDCQPAVALCNDHSHEQVENWLGHCDFNMAQIAVSHPELTKAEKWQAPIIDESDIAFLQYSSGSTGTPKGVMLSHANLLCNTQLINDTYQFKHEDKFLNWLPLYHDMGFVGLMLAPVRLGAQIWFMQPAVVAQRPYKLLKQISDIKATITAGPNFIFDLAVKSVTVSEKAELNLSSLLRFVNGSEPINANTLKQFNEYFADTGLSPKTIKPSYGMAENCLLVTATSMEDKYRTLPVLADQFHLGKIIVKQAHSTPCKNEEQVETLASSGKLVPGITIKIVNPDSRQSLPDGEIGEIMISGDSTSQGYWRKAELNTSNFNQLIDGQPGFMKTGDLGFILDNQLYVSGRSKEMFIVKGRNYYPQDIEHTVMTLSDDVAVHGAAIFEVTAPANESKLILVQELSRKGLKANHEALALQIRDLVDEVHKLSLSAVVFIRPISLPKTSSGKIQRTGCREAYLKNKLKIVANWQRPEDPTEQDHNDSTAMDNKTIAC